MFNLNVIWMLNLNVKSKSKSKLDVKSKCLEWNYCHQNYHNKSLLTQTSVFPRSPSGSQMDDEDDCAALLVTPPHRALKLLIIMSSDLAGNIGRAILTAIQCICHDSDSSPFNWVALLPQRWFTNSLLLFVHAEPSSLMFGGSGAQSQHIITASICFINS